jgi:hypothetical protein
MSRKQEAIRDYLSHEDLLQQLGYNFYKPKTGSLGRAIIQASKNHRSIGWLKNQLDTYFKRHNKNKKGKKKYNGNQK